MRPSFYFCRVVTGVIALSIAGQACAQEQFALSDDTVVINCPDQIELRVLVDYTGKALGIHFIYGEELANKRVELRPSPIELPKKHLLNLLVSLLRVRDLAMVEESPSLYRIVQTEQTARNVRIFLAAGSTADSDSFRMVTQVLPVPSGQVKAVSEKLKSFMSSARSGLVPVPERGLIIVTEYESRIALLQKLILLLDAAPPEMEVRTVPLTGADASTLASQVSAILSESHRLRQDKGSPASVRADILPGGLVLVGTPDQLNEAEALVERLTPETVELSTNVYVPHYLSVDRAQDLIEHALFAPGSSLLPPAAMYQDAQGGRLFVTADTATHTAIAGLLEQEDQLSPAAQRPLRIYRPKHRNAGELLGTLSELLGEGVHMIDHPRSAEPEAQISQATQSSSPRRQVPPVPPADEEASGQSALRISGPDFVLTEDAHTNSILAIGSREFHAQLESLIAELDRRRPQVLIEMTLVAITLSDSMSLGIELEGLDLGDAWDFMAFTNFGLSSIDIATGQRILTPGIGGNGVILRPERVPILLRTLATRGMAKVISTPKLLVADNARATLRNVDEAPFTSVNASDTVATTSFAGFESAGTTLSVTPHISEGDNVTLEYELNFSNFTGGSSGVGVPPPRTTNSFTSTVEVPDGHVVVTGGLAVDNTSDSVSEVPLLGRIPILGALFQSSSKQNTKTKIFAFIRPTILRDDDLEALKYITLEDIEAAELDSDIPPPPGDYLWMR